MSGTTFERDGFKAMMSDIEAGKVGIVITKDLSRLGRDYLKTGEYIEIISYLSNGHSYIFLCKTAISSGFIWY